MLISKNFDDFKTPHLVSMNIMTENGFGFLLLLLLFLNFIIWDSSCPTPLRINLTSYDDIELHSNVVMR